MATSDPNQVRYPAELDGLRFERDPERGVATITLDVPGKLNRVSMLAREHLSALFEACGRDPEVRVVVLAGAGERAFTAGGDIAGFLEASARGADPTAPQRGGS